MKKQQLIEDITSVVGMLLYLSGHTRPDIAFAVHQCAQYTFNPTRKHEVALIRIGRYLKGTMDKGLIMTPTDDPRVDCWVGGSSIGAQGCFFHFKQAIQAGLRVSWLVEKVPLSAASLIQSHPCANIYSEDVQDFFSNIEEGKPGYPAKGEVDTGISLS